MVLKLCTHVTEGIASAHAKFCSSQLKISGDEKSNDGSDIDSYAQG